MTSPGLRKAVGIDFGGTFVKMALVDEAGKIMGRGRISTRDLTGQEAWLAAVERGVAGLLSESALATADLAGLGVGVPGMVDYERGYIYDLTNVPGWSGVFLKDLAEKHFGLRTCVENDVNAMALGECAYGAGRAYHHAVFVTLGTGVGGGIVVDRKLYRGAFSMAGEIGHMSIEKDGIRSPMGRGGLEQYVGNRQIISRAVRALKHGRPSAILDAVGGRTDEVTPKIIAEAAAAGDALALEIFDFVADCLATAFASITYLLQPQVFIVGGGVSQSGKVLFEPLERHLKERLSPHFAERIEIKRAQLGDDAGVIGAATLAWAG
ncbi:MAG: ROK family protein [Kiritimatiellae bacterium]|nr:ROK family protein [Kiritimatiellia bacterium]